MPATGTLDQGAKWRLGMLEAQFFTVAEAGPDRMTNSNLAMLS